MSSILPIFSSHYSYGASILTLEEGGKTDLGGPVSICDIARENHLKQVIIVDDRIDGFIEAHKNLSKTFKPTPAIPVEQLRKSNDSLTVAEASKMFTEATTKYEREKQWSTDPIQLLFGVKLIVCADMATKDDPSLKTQSKVVVFVRNTQGYSDLIRIWNIAWTDGFYYEGRIDWKKLKELWTPNLILALPFFSSFIAMNSTTFSSIVPELPCPAKEVWAFKEVKSGLPFESIITKALNQFVQESGAQVQEVKSVYYYEPEDFMAYQTFRAMNERGTYSAPNVSDLASDQFSFKSWVELTVRGDT